jgi:hypothetical protein
LSPVEIRLSVFPAWAYFDALRNVDRWNAQLRNWSCRRITVQVEPVVEREVMNVGGIREHFVRVGTASDSR